jgi:hypothetical protein
MKTMRYFPLYNILHGVGLNELLNLLFRTAQLESWSHKIQKYLEGAKSTEQVLTRQLLSSKMSEVTLSTTCREKNFAWRDNRLCDSEKTAAQHKAG